MNEKEIKKKKLKTQSLHDSKADVGSVEQKAPDKGKEKKNTSLRLEKQTLKALKILAVEQETSIQSLIERLIKDYLKKHQA